MWKFSVLEMSVLDATFISVITDLITTYLPLEDILELNPDNLYDILESKLEGTKIRRIFRPLKNPPSNPLTLEQRDLIATALILGHIPEDIGQYLSKLAQLPLKTLKPSFQI